MRCLPTLLLAACGAADPAFYTDPVDDLGAYPPGALLRIDAITRVDAVTLGAKARAISQHGALVYRIAYRTEGLAGPDLATARLAIPDVESPEGGFAVVAHLHGTLGLADRCAPSRPGGFGFESGANPHAARMLAEGHIVVEPDYLGLGPPGPHPYMAWAPAGSSVLDAIRAAQQFEDPDAELHPDIGPRVALEGHSQGGHAVLSALAAAPGYAPELDLVAGVAISPPGAPAEVLRHLIDEQRYGGFVAMALVGLSSAHPEVDPAEWLLPEVAALDETLEERCLVGLSGLIGRPPDALLRPEVLAGDWGALAPVLAAEDLGDRPSEVPLLVVHGTADELLPIALTEALVARHAAAGAPIELLAVEGGDHLMLPSRAREDVWAFLDTHL